MRSLKQTKPSSPITVDDLRKASTELKHQEDNKGIHVMLEISKLNTNTLSQYYRLTKISFSSGRRY